jgi:hypothetical protein
MREIPTYGKPIRIRDDLPPGTLTSQLSVPWQSDYRACGTNWWPGGRPNQVTQDGTTFHEWVPNPWGVTDMIQNWWELGFIARNEEAFVETERIAPVV